MKKAPVYKSDEEVILDEFSKRFSGWVIPKVQDEVIARMTVQEREVYHMRIAEFVENKAHQAEFSEWKRMIYETLAVKSETDLQRTALRLCLLFIQAREQRWNQLAMLVPKSKPLQSPAKRI